MLPAALLLSWWLGVFALYLLPWPLMYKLTAVGQVAALWLACCAALLVGFTLTGDTPSPAPASMRHWLPRIGLIAQWALLPVIVRQYSGLDLGDLGSALSDQGNAYRLASEAIEAGAESRRALTVVIALANIAILTALPYFAYHWFTLRRAPVATVLAATPPVLISAYTGRDSLLAPAAMAVIGAALVAVGRRQFRMTKGLALAGILTATVAGFAFVARKFSRYTIEGVTFQYSSCAPGTTCEVPPVVGSLEAAIQTIASYATQGFEGLGHALGAHWAFGGGFSHSPALRRLLADDSQPPLVTDQLDQLGWSASGYWSTGLAHLANDVPWPLVPLVVLTVAILLQRVWADALRTPNPVNITVFGSWLYLLFMLPQNLTLAMNGPHYVAVLALTLLWSVRALQEGSMRHTSPLRRSGQTRPVDTSDSDGSEGMMPAATALSGWRAWGPEASLKRRATGGGP
jgi:hypothetical protein